MAKMGLNEEPEDPLYEKHMHLVKELNLDEETASQAWSSFKTIQTNYTLEGDNLHWLCCAIFVACRNKVTKTISESTVKGNPVSLTSLLRFCNISVTIFFDKIDKWMCMAGIQSNEEFQQKVRKLEDNFVITCKIYKDYFPYFEKIFKAPDLEAIRHRNRKQRPPQCTPTKLFEFTWLLFITIKGRHLLYEYDSVTAYYFLLGCFDLVFRNAFSSKLWDIINPNFEGLPANWNIPSFYQMDAPCIIEKLLQQSSEMLADAIYTKQYTIRNYVLDLMKAGVLHGNRDSLFGLLDPANFEHNYIHIAKAYDQQILNDGNIDERIFLAECQRQYLLQNSLISNGKPSNAPSLNDIEESSVSELPRISSGNGEIAPHIMQTPLTGRRYVGPRDQTETALTSATQSLSQLHAILNGCKPTPSENLSNIFKTCTVDPTESIKNVLERMSQKFLTSLSEQNENIRPNALNDDEKKAQVATSLFYKILENIIVNEKTINKDISVLLEKEVFFECLYPCCLEIVLFSYNAPRKFPWIIEALDIPPSNLVRVIELIVRSKDQLSRNTIKHLSYVEESILESLIWKSSSPFWEDLKKYGEIPKFEEIALPGNMVYNSSTGAVTTKRSLASPGGKFQSPGPSAVESFQSPVNSQVKKQLFPVVKPGQSLLQTNRTVPSATHLMITDSEGNKKLIPIDQNSQIITSAAVSLPEQVKPKKFGSFYIFCRKFYNLAGVRLEDLCTKLSITDLELKRKIWTVFEHFVRKYTELLKDRHLDQVIMCSVYVICKITGNSEKNFTEVMKCYRGQPQSKSDIYRNVLIKSAKETDGVVEPEVRSNLIDFYNNIYVPVMKNYVVIFSNQDNHDNVDILLSPLPSVRCLLSSPRHQVSKNVFVRPYEILNNGPNPPKISHSYYFSRSASKDLKDINKAINDNYITGKRLLSSSLNEDQPSNKRFNRKVQALIEERKVQNME